MIQKILIIFFLITLTNPIFAKEDISVLKHKENIQNIKNKLVQNNMNFGEPKPLGNTGLYYFSNKEGKENKMVFTDKNLSFLISGDIVSLKNGVPNKTVLNSEKTKIAFKLIQILNPENLIHYKSENEKDHIYVFMDYSCPFCKKFHENERDKLLKKGISVTYIPFIRSNVNKILEDTISTYCINDMNKKKNLIDKAFFNPRNYEFKEECKLYDKYLSFMSMGGLIGIEGTPTFITSNGYIIHGLKSANDIYKIMGY
tara:strand:- start:671 stop:1441 length:771 start_codon:yes stop_codon:yes gene_type:complete